MGQPGSLLVPVNAAPLGVARRAWVCIAIGCAGGASLFLAAVFASWPLFATGMVLALAGVGGSLLNYVLSARAAAVTGPLDICLVLAGGRVIACDTLRDPELDHENGGRAVWVASPREPAVVPPGARVKVRGKMPVRSVLLFGSCRGEGGT